MKNVLSVIVLLVATAAFANDLNCDVSLDNGNSFALTLADSGAKNGLNMRAPAIGLFGSCQAQDIELFCRTNKNEIIEIRLNSNSFRWETANGDVLRGSILCD